MRFAVFFNLWSNMYAVLIRRALPLVETAIKNTPAVATKVFSRLNLKGPARTWEVVKRTIENQPMLMGAILWEIGGEAIDLLKEWASSGEERLAEAASAHLGQVYSITTNPATDPGSIKASESSRLADEREDIMAALDLTGKDMSVLLRVRRALLLPDSAYADFTSYVNDSKKLSRLGINNVRFG